MTQAASLITNCTTPRGRLSYPAVFKPQMNKMKTPPQLEFSAQALFENPLSHADFATIKDCAKNACIEKWGPDQAKWPTNVLRAQAIAQFGPDPSKWSQPVPMLRMPWRTQDELIMKAKEKNQAFDHLKPGAIWMTFRTSAVDKTGAARTRPPVVDKQRQPIEDPAKFYAGCWAKFNVTAVAYQKGTNYGVSFYLNACQFVGDAPQFGNRPSVEAAFEAIPEDEVANGETGATQSADSMFS